MRTVSDTTSLKNVQENSAGVSTRDSTIASDDFPLSLVSEEQYSSRASIASTVSDDFYWPNDVIFEVLTFLLFASRHLFVNQGWLWARAWFTELV